ncbi:hypothetical protein Arub01_35800 [Actinomadura rubrobrunea]|uniref:Uncharacterized protein n=1 Tax=Actinomadura rubrobrunea TaxID=115335 RepID=A0A9W6PY58_9ACTN|nr:hypothetical protein [Actinomadura rubrobrunea]GLW65336.1 hypothetical protein Arub01_35800 [Actinomadura rubrobrunea]
MVVLPVAAVRIGSEIALWIGPAVLVIGILAWVTMTILASSRKIHPDRRHDQSPHWGPVEGGAYHYWPGMYAHHLRDMKFPLDLYPAPEKPETRPVPPGEGGAAERPKAWKGTAEKAEPVRHGGDKPSG